jgi:hypothetical protein
MSNLTDRGLSYARAVKELKLTKERRTGLRAQLTQVEEQERRQEMEVTRLRRELLEGAEAL